MCEGGYLTGNKFLVVGGVSGVSHGDGGGVVGHGNGGNSVVGHGDGGNSDSLADVGGGHGLTGGDGDEVLDVGTGDLCDDVAVLNLDGDNLDGGVVHAVLGGDITASVFHGGGDGVSDSGSDNGGDGVGDGGNSVVSIGTSVVSDGVSVSGNSVESISFGISLGIGATSVDSVGGVGNGGITEMVGGFLADLHVFNLFGVDGDGVADVLGGGNTVLGDEDVVLSLAVGGRSGVVGHGGNGGVGVSEAVGVGGVSLGVRVGGGASEGQKARDGNELVHDYLDDFPRCKVELK